MTTATIPVIAIDGPSGSGKGTLCRRLAQQFGFSLLDSGALYRLSALAAQAKGVVFTDGAAVAAVARQMDVSFGADENGAERICLDGEDVTHRVREEKTGELASQVAVLPELRAELVNVQHAARKAPGLVADGRDMGTVIFPEAEVKVFLTASPEERAKRRTKQLQELGKLPADLDPSRMRALTAQVADEIRERDERDRTRKESPLVPAEGALQLDTSSMPAAAVLAEVTALCERKLGIKAR
jgi:cytidylate kinase